MESLDLQKFTAAVATRIVADDGTICMNFEAGQTLPVQKKLHGPALKAGLVPENRLPAFKPGPTEPEEPKPSQREIVEKGLIEACKTLIMRGDPNDFTTVGNPRAASVKKLVDFDFKTKEVERAFGIAMHEVEKDVNESTESSEPDISTT